MREALKQVKKANGGENSCRSKERAGPQRARSRAWVCRSNPPGHARARTRTHAPPLRTQHRQAGTDLHPAGITEERFQVSLTELLACKQSSGGTRANYPHSHIHPRGATTQ